MIYVVDRTGMAIMYVMVGLADTQSISNRKKSQFSWNYIDKRRTKIFNLKAARMKLLTLSHTYVDY